MFKAFKKLITNNSLEDVKREIDLSPMEMRQNLSYDREIEKKMMFQACFGKATDVVKYFIIRRKIDRNEFTKIGREMFTPLFIAIKTANSDLINLLLRYGADMNWRDHDGRSAIVYACDINKMEAAYTLKNHGANINDNTNQNLCVKSLSYFKRALKLGTDVNYVDEKGETILMKAVSNSNIDIINLLLKEKADIYLRSYESGRNALDLAHLLEKEDVLNYFKKNSVYSLADNVITYDLSFALALLIDNNVNKSEEFMKTSMRLRKKYHSTLEVLGKDNPALKLDSDIGSPENIFDSPTLAKSLYIALQMVCRIIKINHPFIEKLFFTISRSRRFLNNSLSIDDLKKFCKLNYTVDQPEISGVYIGMAGACFLCDIQFWSSCETEMFVQFIEQVVDLISETFFPILKNKSVSWPSYVVYEHMMSLLLQLIDFVVDEECANNERLEISISKIAQLYMEHYKTSMLLIAIEKGFGFKTILHLIAGGADVNARGNFNNTPLHLLAEQPASLPEKSEIYQLLIDAGGRIDATNDYGVKPQISLAAE